MIHFNQKIKTELINTNLNLNQKYNSKKCSKENKICTALYSEQRLNTN